MEGRLVLKNCCLWGPDGGLRQGQAVAVEEDRIVQVADDVSISIRPGDWEVACRGRLAALGHVSAHCHLALRQAVHLNEAERLEIERCIRPEEQEVLSADAISRALRSGFTAVVDQIACPTDVHRALLAEAEVVRRMGIRAVVSHATESRPEDPSGMAQLEANAAFIRETTNDGWVVPALGFGRAGKCDDSLLERIRLLQDPLGAVLVGCSAPGNALGSARALVASEPQGRWVTWLSQASAGAEEGGWELSGTGLGWGEPSDWPVSAGGALEVRSEAERAFAQRMVAGPAFLRGVFWGNGSAFVEPGALADLVVYDLVLGDADIFGWQSFLEIQQSKVAWTIVKGRVAVREGELLGVDALELSREAAQVRSLLWKRAGVVPG